MVLRTRFPLLTGLVFFVGIWVLVVGLRSTGHMPSLLEVFTSAGSNGNPAPPPPVDQSKEDMLKDKEAKLKIKEEQLMQREKAISRDEKLSSSMKLPSPEKTLVSYVYTESETNRRNLEFFIRHGLYASADFVFSFNGDTDAYEMLPSNPKSEWYNEKVTNIEVIMRDNTCYDFGAHGEALLREWDEKEEKLSPMLDDDKGGKKFWESYSRFIIMNASIRGPYMPYWSEECWSEAFMGKVTEKTKLVGMSYNCHGNMGHVQSMLWATDRLGISILMQKPPAGVGYWCPIDMVDAIFGETRSTPTMQAAGYEVDAMTAVYHSHDGDDLNGDGKGDHKPDGYLENCEDEDFFHENAYYGFNVHPYETIFMKSARKMNELLLGNLTLWADGSGYSSYDVCDRRLLQ